MSNEIQPVSMGDLKSSRDISAIVPSNVDEAYKLASIVLKAGLAPDTYNNDPKKILIGIMKSLEVGLPPLTGLNNIAIINGRPCIWGDAAVALVQNSGYVGDMEADKTMPTPTEQIADWPDEYGWNVSITRSGHGGGTYTGSFTVADAKRARLWLNHKRKPWIDYPDRMLFNRARAFALRDGFADALMGLSIREEMEDIPTAAPAAADVSFLEEDGPEDAAEAAGEPDEVAEVEGAEDQLPLSGLLKAPGDDFDYVSGFVDFLQGLKTKQAVEDFWNGSQEQRDRLSKEDQGKLAMAYAERYAEVPNDVEPQP